MGRGEQYADATRRLRAVMDTLEASLSGVPDGCILSPATLGPFVVPYTISADQAALALLALADLGIVEWPGSGRFSQETLAASAAFRVGVRAGLEAAGRGATRGEARLVQALPVGLAPEQQRLLQEQADDLRGALVGLIISARQQISLASPFWDDETCDELGELLVRRLRVGVRVDVLGRPPTRADDAFARLVDELQGHGNVRAFVWSEPLRGVPFGSQTFHFKCIVADHGAKAYLGSANFTRASLRSRMELGVIFEGDNAMKLARIMEQALAAARPYQGFKQ